MGMSRLKKIAIYSTLIGGLTIGGVTLASRTESGREALEKTLETVVFPLDLALSISDFIRATIEEIPSRTTPYKIDKNLLNEYPEMQKINGVCDWSLFRRQDLIDVYRVSAVYHGPKEISGYLQDVKKEEQTVGIEHHISLIEECFNGLVASGRYPRFVAAERKKLDKMNEETCEVIGCKVRGGDAIYR